MSFETILLAILIVILGGAQYALCVQAIRDLARRPRVRGDNKVLWVMTILCIPIAGAIVYNWMGPTSFVRRPVVTTVTSLPHESPQRSWGNVTSIDAARSARRRSTTTEAVRAHLESRPRGGSSTDRSQPTGS